MTASPAAARRVPGARWRSVAVVVFALLLFAWTHRHALTLIGFADDLALLAQWPRLAARGTLWQTVWAGIDQPLWAGSTMWRPWVQASFALDATLWGAVAERWHLTNLALHVANAVLVGLLARELGSMPEGRSEPTLSHDTEAASAWAFALFLLNPWAPEVTLWLVGRFDGWATFGVLLSLWAAPRSRRSLGYVLLSLAAAALAYAAKESALIVVVWLPIVLVALVPWPWPWSRSWASLAQSTQRRWAIVLLGHFALAGIYLVWRAHLFGGALATVYGATPAASPVILAQRFAAQFAFPVGLAPLAPVAAGFAALIALLLLAAGWRDARSRRARFVALAMIVAALGALALYHAEPPTGGDGYRLYYLTAVGAALALSATPSAARGRWPTVALLALVVACAQWQSRTAREWTQASASMDAALRGLRGVAASLPATDYALVLMPDRLGHVPFARNAQGALPDFAGQWRTTEGASGWPRSRLIVFTPPQLAEWQRLANEGVVPRLAEREDAPENPTRYYCFDERSGALRDVGYWTPTDPLVWSARWRHAVAAQCPALRGALG